MLTAPVETTIDSLIEAFDNEVTCNMEWTRGEECGAKAEYRGMGHNYQCAPEQLFLCIDCLAKMHILRMTNPHATCFICRHTPIVWDLRQL